MIPPPDPPQEATDIFSISDQVLADRLQFIEEIGFGNWGSVWLCRPKPDSSSPSTDSPHALNDTKIAVKLVHRSKTSTTAARVRSLWNEMKVVRSFKHEPHPSIIPFYSFIITPSYALITMAYHPRLVPVEVPESTSRLWFHSLLSGVEFLHKRGVVHNDIKPANILLSQENIPVLVDFGFAERYDVNSSTAFHSNLSYGTPEYLSPERARGLPHDTRKSDVWSLGVTLFEILIGRTPFEHSEGEQFTTKEDLEKYWNRTLRGKWVGTWKMSKGLEKLLRRMVLPNADLRCTASEAMLDAYWSQDAALKSHRKSSSISHAPTLSLRLEKDVAMFSDVVPPWSPQEDVSEKPTKEHARRDSIDKEADRANSPSEVREKPNRRSSLIAQNRHARSQSQPKLQTPEGRGVTRTKRNALMPSLLATLSPVKHSPPTTSTVAVSSAAGKENAAPAMGAKAARTTRRPLGPRGPTPPSSPVQRHNQPLASKENAPPHAMAKEKQGRRSRVFKDVTSANQNADTASAIPKRVEKPKEVLSSSVRNRMREWERERERLREMEQLEERMREAEEEREKERRRYEKEMEEAREQERVLELEMRQQRELELERQRTLELERVRLKAREAEPRPALSRIITGGASSVTPPGSVPITPLGPLHEEPLESDILNDEHFRSGNESGISILKQSLKVSLGGAMRLYKSSALALGRSTPGLELSHDLDEDDVSRISMSDRASWEDDSLIRKANSSLPGVRQAVRNEGMATANQLDRMTIWIRNVEQVVEDARQNFAASSPTTGLLPPLPLAPVSRRPSTSHDRSNRSSRVPRKILPANKIFVDEYESGIFDRIPTSFDQSTVEDTKAETTGNVDQTLPTIPSEQPSFASGSMPLPVPETPSRRRRATVVTRSPEPARKKSSDCVVESPSKRREKSRSQYDLLRPITPVAKLEFELEKLALPPRPQRLSAVVDRSIFIAPSPMPRLRESDVVHECIEDDLTSSPLHVDPYPQRIPASNAADTLDTPTRKHVEEIYDRFLMSTAGVKRVGRGYQSDYLRPISNIPVQASGSKRGHGLFHSTRRPMLPPVSSEDLRRASSVDEFGVVVPSARDGGSSPADSGKNTVAIVRKAFKAIVTGKSVSTRTKVV
ncbi:uncharacterized protein FIBRA_08459 [Fibroporia radiculosa]|uniref:Protein kinase domain-containing protein n=1 Tax=Fibroporia radiculosa TaxID=599839 RepID=J4H568_9APHY|nr:uncharacterized protein FIBRA_08459 [Fibroporia radiculosa]CCM06214.1 predicted protein [Fibroporia radiculosa]